MNKEDKIWTKIWDGKWGMISCSYPGYIYTKDIKRFLGASFDNYLVIGTKGLSAGFVPEKEIIRLGKKLARKVKRDDKTALLWTKNLRKQTDYINKLLKGIYKEKKLAAEHYRSVLETMKNYVPWHTAIKFSGDHLPVDEYKKTLSEFSRARVYSENIFVEVEDFFQGYLTQLSRKTSYSVSLLNELTELEIEQYNRKEKLPSIRKLEKRFAKVVLIYRKGKRQILEGKRAVLFEKRIIKGMDLNVIKGQTAFGGVVRGRARIILDPLHQKIKKGEILVAGMTRPSFLPLIRQSAAFITDAGGTLSHAAITARELKKPCIVGTKIATKVLKDGDLVEVDAKRSIVKILKRA